MATSLLRFAFRLVLPFTVLAGVTAYGQTATSSSTSKVALIDTRQFYEPGKGIQKLVNISRQVEGEFAGVQKELQILQNKIAALNAEIQQLSANQAVAKQEESDRLQRDYNFRRNEAHAAYERRRVALMTPVIEQINKALREHLETNGFAVILDASKLEGVLLATQPTTDVTQAFINAFNIKYPASASAASNR